jgi:two-component system, NarL family, nitrate/nitrite response regulator NarL
MAIRCLLVDDSDRFLRSARILLERDGIAVVGVASNGAEALALARELRPDVILVDIKLGAESGFDLARRLADPSEIGSTDDNVPRVILISSYAEDDFQELIAVSPVAGFVSKSALSASAVRQLLDEPPANSKV